MKEQIFPNIRNTSVVLNGVKLEAVTGVETFEYTEYYRSRELLSGFQEHVPLYDKFTVKLRMAEELSFPKDGFVLVVKTPHVLKTYTRCRLKSVTQKLMAPNVYETVYEIETAFKDQIETA